MSRVVLVTGGARGLGRGLTIAFAETEATVVVCGRDEPAPGAVPATWVRCDVRDPTSVEALFAEIKKRWGKIDVAVNNAGGTPYAPAATMSPRLAERVIALNLLGPLYVAQQANAFMQDQPEGGVILNIGSAAAIRPAPGAAPYNAAKAGLLALTRSLALEWAPRVRVNCVSVGLVRTESVNATYGEDLAAVESTIPMGRLAEPADVAAACLWLASPAAAYLTGTEVLVDGGGEEPSFLRSVTFHSPDDPAHSQDDPA